MIGEVYIIHKWKGHRYFDIYLTVILEIYRAPFDLSVFVLKNYNVNGHNHNLLALLVLSGWFYISISKWPFYWAWLCTFLGLHMMPTYVTISDTWQWFCKWLNHMWYSGLAFIQTRMARSYVTFNGWSKAVLEQLCLAWCLNDGDILWGWCFLCQIFLFVLCLLGSH